MSTEKLEQEPMIGLADRLAAARKRQEGAASGKPRVSKEDVAGESLTLSELLRQRLEIGDMLDQIIDEGGVQYGLLAKVNRAIGRKLFSRGGSGGAMPQWIGELKTVEYLRNRLAMELAEHSSGGGNASVAGEVQSRETLVAVFKKNHAGVAGMWLERE